MISTKPTAYACLDCGWSRIILDGETPEEARAAHEQTDVHKRHAFVLYEASYQNRAYSGPGTRRGAEAFARANCPRGWYVVSVTRNRGVPVEAYTIRSRRAR